jgi:hypothetical protein
LFVITASVDRPFSTFSAEIVALLERALRLGADLGRASRAPLLATLTGIFLALAQRL